MRARKSHEGEHVLVGLAHQRTEQGRANCLIINARVSNRAGLRTVDSREMSDSGPTQTLHKCGLPASSTAGLLIRRSLVRVQVGEPRNIKGTQMASTECFFSCLCFGIPVSPPMSRSNTALSQSFLRAAFGLACIAVGALSLMPVEYLPPQAFNIWDKAQHSAGFAGLAVLGHLAYPWRLWRIVLGLLAYGAGVEWAQSAAGWRDGDGLDWIADAVGVLSGSALVTLSRTKAPEPHRDAQ